MRTISIAELLKLICFEPQVDILVIENVFVAWAKVITPSKIYKLLFDPNSYLQRLGLKPVYKDISLAFEMDGRKMYSYLLAKQSPKRIGKAKDERYFWKDGIHNLYPDNYNFARFHLHQTPLGIQFSLFDMPLYFPDRYVVEEGGCVTGEYYCRYVLRRKTNSPRFK